MSRLRKCPGFECVKILCNKFGFRVVRQTGSHMILRKDISNGAVGTSVPNHKELKLGTLKGILELAKVNEDEFCEFQ